MPEEKEEIEVTVIDRAIVRTFPPTGPARWTARVMYSTEDLPPDTISIDLHEIAPEKVDELRKQIEAREGDLWEKYIKVERKRIREHIEERRAAKPERYVV